MFYKQSLATGELYLGQLISSKSNINAFKNCLVKPVNSVEFILVTCENGSRILFQGPIWIDQPGAESSAVNGLTLKNVILKFYKEIVTLNPRENA
jgi:hypothetical protein